jgi:uncharacterized protein YbaP (TraB family)
MFDFLKRLARMAGPLSLGLASAACATPSEAVTAEVPPPEAIPGPALWEVKDDDTTIYLFGTVHALPPHVQWYDQRIQRAFASSDELVTEISLADSAASGQAIAGSAALTTGGTLRDLMAEQDREEYEAALVSLGLPIEALDRVEPWFAAMNLSLLPLLQSGYDTGSGVEMKLQQNAGDKQRDALETIDDQVSLFDGLPINAQLAFLDDTVAAVPTAADSLTAMVNEWLKGDAVTLAELMNAELTDPALYQRLLVDRNARWAGWIEQRLQTPGTVFVAVGAGHLAGAGSVQDQLAARGLEVTRVWM